MAAYKQVSRLTPEDAAYIAGLVDGEGTVSLLRKHRHDNRQVVVSISSTERCLLDYVLKTVGAGRITNKRTYSDKHAKSVTYTITNRQALDLLKQIAPYLKSYKAQRTTLLLDHYIRLTPRNGRYTPEQQKAREAFAKNILGIRANQ